MRGGLRALLGIWAFGMFGCSTAAEPTAPATSTQEALVHDGVQKVSPPDPRNYVQFGWSVAISTNFAVIGAPNADFQRGVAYLYERSGSAWVFRQKLTAPDGGGFGTTVAVSGSTIVVGAPRVSVPTEWNIGAVYVYAHDGSAATLSQKIPSQTIVGTPVSRWRVYGERMALEGSVLVIDDGIVSHVLDRVGGLFTEVETLAASPDSEFNRSIALSGNTLVRCVSLNVLGIGGAAADVYVRSGSPAHFRLQQRIIPMADELESFGDSVAVSGDTALIGAKPSNGRAGAAYVYTRSGGTWTNQATLVEPNQSPFNFFASSVGLAGDVAVIGSPGRDHHQRDDGSAYVFIRSETGWSEARELVAFDGHQGDGLGSSLAVSPNFALVGAPHDDIPALVQGSAYFFALEAPPPREICVGTCSGDADCPSGKYCDSTGICLTQKAAGRACEAADCRAADCAVCETGFCVDGFCCQSACAGEGFACASLLTARSNGICSMEVEGGCGTGGVSSGGNGGSGPSGTGGGGAGGSSDNGTGGSGFSGAGGTAPSSGGTTGTTGGASGAGGGNGNGEAPCVRVAPDGDDATAVASDGATPFRNLQPAIDFADTHRHLGSRVCIAAGPACGASTQFTFTGPDDDDLRMRSGIGVFGRYESSTWTRCTDSVTRILPTTERGIVFGSDITTLTELNGVEALGPSTDPTAAVTIDGAHGAKLADMSVIAIDFSPEVTYGVRIEPDSEVTIERSRIVVAPGSAWSAALSSSSSDLLLIDSSVVSSRGRFGTALELEDPREVHVLRSSISAAGGAVLAVGDVGALSIEDSTIEAFADLQAATGIEIAATAGTGVTLRRNVVRVEGYYDLTGIALVGGGAVVDSNQIECSGVGLGNTLGLLCDGLGEAASCREVTRNLVTGPSCSGSCAYDSTGMVIAGMGTLVDSNRVEGGCSSGATWSAALGLRISGSAHVQNNLFYGATCAGGGEGIRGVGVVVDSDEGAVDLSSNYIDGGRATAPGCTTIGLKLFGGDAKLRNNVVAPGLCPSAFNLDQEFGAPFPSVLGNNDLSPGSETAQLYRIIGGWEPKTLAEVNALPGASGNFSAACQYPLEAGSACINAGTAEGAPELDIDGDARDDGAPDVGPDEFPDAGAACDANPWLRLQKLVPADGGPSDTLLVSVSVSGDRAMLGTVPDEEFSKPPGAVYVFEHSGATWSETQKLTAPDGAPADRFGFDVAVDGDTAVVGATGAEPDAIPHRGAAYVFVRSSSAWNFVQKLVGPGTSEGSAFGWYVALSGDTAAIASDDGAYVYRRSASSWSVEQVLFPNAALPSLSLEGDTLLAGYPCDPSSTPEPGCIGAASVFVRSGTSWSEQQRLVASDGLAYDNFGSAVALWGDWAFVAANQRNEGRGAVYAFQRTGSVWTARQILTGFDTPPSGQFGWQIAAEAGNLLVDASYQNAFFAFELAESSWVPRQKLAPIVAAGPSWGSDVALSAHAAFLGALEGSPQSVRASATVLGPCGG